MNALVRIVLVFLLVPLLTGSSCTVVYCSGDCDPCVNQCGCSPKHRCNAHQTVDFASTHTLELYDFGVRSDPSGAVTRVYANILGLSLERIHGPGPYEAESYIEFTRDVIVANPELFGRSSRANTWALDGMERFGERVLVRWQRCASPSGPLGSPTALAGLLSFFDERANLIEIQLEVHPPMAGEPAMDAVLAR